MSSRPTKDRKRILEEAPGLQGPGVGGAGGPVCPERPRMQDRWPRASGREQVEDMVLGLGMF